MIPNIRNLALNNHLNSGEHADQNQNDRVQQESPFGQFLRVNNLSHDSDNSSDLQTDKTGTNSIRVNISSVASVRVPKDNSLFSSSQPGTKYQLSTNGCGNGTQSFGLNRISELNNHEFSYQVNHETGDIIIMKPSI